MDDTLTINWYRTPVDKDVLRRVTQRSDLKGALQAVSFLGLITLTGTAAFLSWGRIPWPLVVLLFFIHATFYAFLLTGFHELIHRSVFKSRFLNELFLRIYSFLAFANHNHFRASHMAHHKYTLHPPNDSEVLLPLFLTWKDLALFRGFLNPLGFYETLKLTVLNALGKLSGSWQQSLFPETTAPAGKRLTAWARFLLVGHGLIIVLSFVFDLWPLPILTTFTHLYGYWLRMLCIHTQHDGLMVNVDDFRLCSRTFTMSPFVEFLYWHMNYHTEHHMYAAVPCYELRNLHEILRHDLPPSTHGLRETWKLIRSIMRKQRDDPKYQYEASLPGGHSSRPVFHDTFGKEAADDKR